MTTNDSPPTGFAECVCGLPIRTVAYQEPDDDKTWAAWTHVASLRDVLLTPHPLHEAMPQWAREESK